MALLKKTIYQDLLPEELKALGYFADEYFSEEIYSGKIRIITEKIIPFIRNSSSTSYIREKWKTNELNLFRIYNKKKSECCKEIKKTIASLKQKIKNDYENTRTVLRLHNESSESDKNYLNLKDFKKALNRFFKHNLFDNLIQTAEKIIEPLSPKEKPTLKQLKDTSQLLEQLCKHLLAEDALDLVKDDAHVIYERGHTFDWETKSNIPYGKPQIKSFKFSDKLNTLIQIHKKLYAWDNSPDTCIAYERLLFFTKCWDKIDLNLNKCFKSYDHQACILEIDAIKKQKNHPMYFLTESNIDRYLKIILDDVTLYYAIDENIKTPQKSLTDKTYKFVLRMHDLYFLLEVEFITDGKKETYLLKKFKSQDSAPYEIAEKICNSEHRSEIKADTTISRFLIETKLNGALGSLFLPKSGRNKDVLKTWYTTVHIGANESQKRDNLRSRFFNPTDDELKQINEEISCLERWNS